jgi:hypothetical protein
VRVHPHVCVCVCVCVCDREEDGTVRVVGSSPTLTAAGLSSHTVGLPGRDVVFRVRSSSRALSQPLHHFPLPLPLPLTP